jgi:hypothetical protein
MIITSVCFVLCRVNEFNWRGKEVVTHLSNKCGCTNPKKDVACLFSPPVFFYRSPVSDTFRKFN